MHRHILEPLGNESPLILDVGANKGQTAIGYRQAFPNARIICFEPFPQSYADMHERLQADEGIELLPYAVADQPGQRIFHINPKADATNSLLGRETSGRRYFLKENNLPETITVEAITLDQFLEERGIATVAILKLDVQGGEWLALQGAARSLARQAFHLIYTETFFVSHYEGSVLFPELCRFLDGCGYTLFDLCHLEHAANGQLRYGDATFVSQSFREQVLHALPEEP